MLFVPKKFKFKKIFLRQVKTKNFKFNVRMNTTCVIQSKSYGFLTPKRLFKLNLFIKKTSFFFKKSKFRRRVMINTQKTKKPLKSRMGKGSGDIANWFSFIKPGTILYEFKLPSLEDEELIFLYKYFKKILQFLRLPIYIFFSSSWYPRGYWIFDKKFRVHVSKNKF